MGPICPTLDVTRGVVDLRWWASRASTHMHERGVWWDGKRRSLMWRHVVRWGKAQDKWMHQTSEKAIANITSSTHHVVINDGWLWDKVWPAFGIFGNQFPFSPRYVPLSLFLPFVFSLLRHSLIFFYFFSFLFIFLVLSLHMIFIYFLKN